MSTISLSTIPAWIELEASLYSKLDNSQVESNSNGNKPLAEIFTKMTEELGKIDSKVKAKDLIQIGSVVRNTLKSRYCGKLTVEEENCLQLYDALIEKTAQSYIGRYDKLFNKLLEKSDAPPYSAFLMRVVCVAQEKIAKTEAVGFIFKISKEGEHSYIIGTVHQSSKAMSCHPLAIKIVENSSELITEIGDTKESRESFEVRLEVLKNSQPFNYSLDMDLTMLARAKQIKITGLESMREQHAYYDSYNKALGIPSDANGDIKNYLSKAYGAGIGIEAWHQGNLEKLEKYDLTAPPPFKEISDNRNKNWENTLIQKLNASPTPIAIAVGASHLIGENGLIKMFQNAGFDVEQMRSEG